MFGRHLNRVFSDLSLRLRGQLRLFGDTGRPTQAHLSPTDRCNLTCRQCDIWRVRPGLELSTAEWKRVLTELAELAGPISVNFAGGEPFLRKDLLELIEFGVKLGFTVSANTNGVLVDRALARRCYEAGLDILYLSLDGARAATHDRLRNRPGTFEGVMTALEQLACFPSPRVVLATILFRESVGEVEALVDLVRSRDLQIVFQPLYQTFGQPYDSGWYRRSALLPEDMEVVDRQIDKLIAIRRADGPICNEVAQLEAFKAYFRAPTAPNGLRCRAGFSDVAVDAYGDVLMCYHLRAVGNVRRDALKALWWSREAALRRQEVAGCPRTCNLQNCNFGSEDSR